MQMKNSHSPPTDRYPVCPQSAFPLVYILSMTSYGMEYPLASQEKLPSRVSSQILMDPHPLIGRPAWETEKSLT